MKLLVIVLNYKVADLALDCLRSIEPEISRVADARVTVVENGSGDDSAERIRQAMTARGWDGWATLLPLAENLGFTGGNNLVIRAAMLSPDRPEYVLLLNADTLVRAGAISTLVRFMDEHPQAGIAGSRLEYPDGRPQGTPFRFQGIASEFDRATGIGWVSRWLERWATCPPKPRPACAVDWVAGASMMIRREVIQAIGLLDEGFFAYFEDMDYCLNARRAGWPTWYVPESLIVHLEGGSSGIGTEANPRRPEYWFQARRRYFLKNYGMIYTALTDSAFLAGYTLGHLRRRLQHRPDPNPPHLLSDSFRHSVFVAGFQVENKRMPGKGVSL